MLFRSHDWWFEIYRECRKKYKRSLKYLDLLAPRKLTMDESTSTIFVIYCISTAICIVSFAVEKMWSVQHLIIAYARVWLRDLVEIFHTMQNPIREYFRMRSMSVGLHRKFPLSAVTHVFVRPVVSFEHKLKPGERNHEEQ